MRGYFKMTGFEPTNRDEAALFAASYLEGEQRARFLASFHKGDALRRLWKSLDEETRERMLWAEARIACWHSHLPYQERLAREQADRLRWDAMAARHIQEEVEEFLDGIH